MWVDVWVGVDVEGCLAVVRTAVRATARNPGQWRTDAMARVRARQAGAPAGRPLLPDRRPRSPGRVGRPGRGVDTGGQVR